MNIQQNVLCLTVLIFSLMISLIRIFCCLMSLSNASRLGISSTQINRLLKFMESFRLDLVQLLLNLLIYIARQYALCFF